MTLFAILGLPCFTLLAGSLSGRWGLGSGRPGFPPRGIRAVQFLKGFLCAFPVFLLMLILKRHVPISYRFFPLYLYSLSLEHLIPALPLGLCYFLLLNERGFQELLFFSGGYYSLLSLGSILAQYGHYEPHGLFLLPAVRMATSLFLPILFLRHREWRGLLKALSVILLIVVPAAGGAVSYLYMRFYVLSAVAVAGLLLAGSLTWFLAEREG